MRMKSIANLASDNAGSKKRRRGAAGGNDNDDTFGANDDDWGVYRTIATGEGSDDEGGDNEDEMMGALKALEAQLLEHDAAFTAEHTLEAETDWSKSLMHAFLRGPRPHDGESAREAHQVHLNVERIRVAEVVFQPSMAGVDQAGVVEVAGDMLTQRLGAGTADALLRDVFLTGGNTLFAGFEERLRDELRAVLPAEAALSVRRARDPLLDAWRGAAAWASTDAWRGARVTREEYAEKGGEYLKVSADADLLAAAATGG